MFCLIIHSPPSIGRVQAYPLSSLVAVYWLPGHRLTEWSALDWWHRYGPPGLCWWLASKAPWKYHWQWGPVDGPFAVAEIAAGAIIYGGLTLL